MGKENGPLNFGRARIPIIGQPDRLDIQVTVDATGNASVRNLQKKEVANIELAFTFAQLAVTFMSAHLQASAAKLSGKDLINDTKAPGPEAS